MKDCVQKDTLYDVLIVGAGVMGAMTARKLSRYNVKTLVVERAGDIGEGATKANSGILYAGFHPRGGSLKGISCVEGNKAYDQICEELGVSMERIGSLFVAFHPEGEDKLEEKYRKGLKNGAEGMKIISGDEVRAMEPALSERVTKALYAPTTAIISPFELIWALSLSAHKNGVDFVFDTEVTGVENKGDYYEVQTNQGIYKARYVVNTAGEGADVIESFVRPQDLEIKPRRGEYYIFDKQKSHPLIKHVIYQAQETDEGGTLITPTVDGNIIAGPTSENVPGFEHRETSKNGLAHVERVCKKVLPDIDMSQVIGSFAGVRANIMNIEKERKDFVVRVSSDRMVSALGIKNPGMTASPYLTDMIVQFLNDEGLELNENPDYQARVTLPVPFLKETPERQAELFSQDPAFAHVLCRCEEITEGDILRILRGPLPPRNFNGLKLRLRVGMGRCQGGFCTSKILELLCKEWKCEPWEIFKYEDKSNLVKGWVK